MLIPKYFPFTRLKLPTDESVIWYGCNPTFHRAFEYGIVITNIALYLCRPVWLFASWRRIPILNIKHTEFTDLNTRPQLNIHTVNRIIAFRTPYDGYKDEMDIDKRKLLEAKSIINGMCGQSHQSEKSTYQANTADRQATPASR
jgi:hypothetical protein